MTLVIARSKVDHEVVLILNATRGNCMNSEQSPDGITDKGGESASITPSTAELNRRLGISPAPRMLTRSEIILLRQSAREIAQATRKAFRSEGGASGH